MTLELMKQSGRAAQVSPKKLPLARNPALDKLGKEDMVGRSEYTVDNIGYVKNVSK